MLTCIIHCSYCCQLNILTDKRNATPFKYYFFEKEKNKDVASDVGVNFKNVGVLSIESSLFHLFHYTFLQTKHLRKGY